MPVGRSTADQSPLTVESLSADKGGLAVLVGAAVRSLVIVDATEAVSITEFGRPVRLIQTPGLWFKAPYQTRRGFDMLRIESPPPREMLTRDKKILDVAWHAVWRIDDVDPFLRTPHRRIPQERPLQEAALLRRHRQHRPRCR